MKIESREVSADVVLPYGMLALRAAILAPQHRAPRIQPGWPGLRRLRKTAHGQFTLCAKAVIDKPFWLSEVGQRPASHRVAPPVPGCTRLLAPRRTLRPWRVTHRLGEHVSVPLTGGGAREPADAVTMGLATCFAPTHKAPPMIPPSADNEVGFRSQSLGVLSVLSDESGRGCVRGSGRTVVRRMRNGRGV
jgi:hypothetical protein